MIHLLSQLVEFSKESPQYWTPSNCFEHVNRVRIKFVNTLSTWALCLVGAKDIFSSHGLIPTTRRSFYILCRVYLEHNGDIYSSLQAESH